MKGQYKECGWQVIKSQQLMIKLAVSGPRGLPVLDRFPSDVDLLVGLAESNNLSPNMRAIRKVQQGTFGSH